MNRLHSGTGILPVSLHGAQHSPAEMSALPGSWSQFMSILWNIPRP